MQHSKTPEEFELVAFNKFENMTDALSATCDVVRSEASKRLCQFLRQNVKAGEILGVSDAKFCKSIREKSGLSCLHNQGVLDLMREIRHHLQGLISSSDFASLSQMSIGLSHSLSRHKLKLSPQKASTMTIQAISLLDDLDKELNTFSMRIKEWYGWHFPEMAKIILDNITYSKIVLIMGTRENLASMDLSATLAPQIEKELKEASFISLGTEISVEDLVNIRQLCDMVVSLSHYRTHLCEYLRTRMNVIAPNLTILVGEIVGARLIAHAGSLIDLAKHPASTIQILGAEKALFRALNNKGNTPKYGLIYHAPLVCKSSNRIKGKISRILAAKCSLSVRVDALDDSTDATIGIDGRAKVESRLRQFETKYTCFSEKSGFTDKKTYLKKYKQNDEFQSF
jgi:nucleolar protein 58